MDANNQNKTDVKQSHVKWRALAIFAATLIIICGLVFLFKYDIAYDDLTDGGWLPPSIEVIVIYIFWAILALIASFLLKIFLKERVSIISLLLASVFIPIICYNFNYHTLKKEGPLYFLVDDGGIFHFITIGDYNFDGINDKRYHILYDERKYSSRYGGHFDDTIIDYIDTFAIGTGGGLSSCHCFYKWEERYIMLFLDEVSVKLKQVEILVAFQDGVKAENVSFYLDDYKLDHIVNKNNSISLIFDADTCLELQNRLIGEEWYIPIYYIVNE